MVILVIKNRKQPKKFIILMKECLMETKAKTGCLEKSESDI